MDEPIILKPDHVQEFAVRDPDERTRLIERLEASVEIEEECNALLEQLDLDELEELPPPFLLRLIVAECGPVRMLTQQVTSLGPLFAQVVHLAPTRELPFLVETLIEAINTRAGDTQRPAIVSALRACNPAMAQLLRFDISLEMSRRYLQSLGIGLKLTREPAAYPCLLYPRGYDDATQEALFEPVAVEALVSRA